MLALFWFGLGVAVGAFISYGIVSRRAARCRRRQSEGWQQEKAEFKRALFRIERERQQTEGQRSATAEKLARAELELAALRQERQDYGDRLAREMQAHATTRETLATRTRELSDLESNRQHLSYRLAREMQAHAATSEKAATVTREFDEFLQAFDSREEREKTRRDLVQLRQEKLQLERRIGDLDTERDLLQQQLANANDRLAEQQRAFVRDREEAQGRSLSLRTQEVDLYEGERQTIVLDVLATGLQSLSKGSRRHRVIADIVESNDAGNRKEEIEAELRRIFTGYKRLSSKDKTDLTALGFELSEKGKHFTIIFGGDRRYLYTFAKSCSDKRGGMNVFTEIRRLCL